MLQGVERRIVVLRLDADRDSMKSINKPQGGKGLVFLSNDPTISAYADWTVVSHSFQLLPDGSGVISILFERPAKEPVEE
jgi:hypothetical protein